MDKPTSSRRKAKHLPPIEKITTTCIEWGGLAAPGGRGISPCQHCGEPYLYGWKVPSNRARPSEIKRRLVDVAIEKPNDEGSWPRLPSTPADSGLLTDKICPACGKNPTSLEAKWCLVFLLYLISSLVFLCILMARDPGFAAGFGFAQYMTWAGGLFLLFFLWYLHTFFWWKTVTRKIREQIASTESEWAEDPDSLELIRRIATFHWFLREWKSCLSLYRQARYLDGKNESLNAQIEATELKIRIDRLSIRQTIRCLFDPEYLSEKMAEPIDMTHA